MICDKQAEAELGQAQLKLELENWFQFFYKTLQ